MRTLESWGSTYCRLDGLGIWREDNRVDYMEYSWNLLRKA